MQLTKKVEIKMKIAHNQAIKLKSSFKITKATLAYFQILFNG